MSHSFSPKDKFKIFTQSHQCSTSYKLIVSFKKLKFKMLSLHVRATERAMTADSQAAHAGIHTCGLGKRGELPERRAGRHVPDGQTGDQGI